MIKIIVCGAAGRMGKRIIACAGDEEGLEITGAVERSGHHDLGMDAGELSGIGNIAVALTDSLSSVIENGDVVIDFSSPESTLDNAAVTAKNIKSLVVGTTGFSREEEDRLKETVRGIACVFSPNMSVGVNLLFKLVEEVAGTLGDEYDIEIIEAHHRLKKDAPSGTAAKLAQYAATGRDRNLSEIAVYGREGMVGERPRGEIGIHAIRAGDIVGDHTVLFSTPGERIELVHRAHSRDTFARGALRAARFAATAQPGLYTMHDVIKNVEGR
ncbi:MAG: 4-hydroxy-tetrahydrodipicolinate reductase [Candidatus Auribacterota bacterium]|nr:4-hydroxy-tetrahydrodipicolinate reductase [Candidatus Auribacterota bacterium]